MGRLAKPKGVSRFNEELELKGYKPVDPADIEATYLSMINLNESKLREAAKDPVQPIIVKIIAKHLLGEDSFDVLERMLDRGIGKAVQRSENLNKHIVVTVQSYDGIE